MSTVQKPFKVSTGLKDLIGQGLIIDDSVAVFELVKNAFDAHASSVRLTIEDDRFVIADNGKGMSQKDIVDKWLFVAYSAKKDGSEDENYREHVGERSRPFAGAMGVGRFSCDRLGSHLKLTSKAARNRIQSLTVDWSLYEGNSKTEFGTVLNDLAEQANWDEPTLKPDGPTGTILEISGLRTAWTRSKLQDLKRELAKLIDPFDEGSSAFAIEIVAPEELQADKIDEEFNAGRREDQGSRVIVNGRIDNPILEVVGKKTTAIHIRLVNGGANLESTLEDRGELVYKIREPNLYPGLTDTKLRADIYFLNRSAKVTFSYRMGLPVVRYGSIFLFRNGFRLFPIGAEGDDYFGLNQRKQQGQRRYLGGRDLIGRVDIRGVKGFDEATSRNQGLIKNEQVEELIECIRDKCVRRLEKYVVDITWKDKPDQYVGDTSRMLSDTNSSLISQLVSRLSDSEGIELLEYNENLVRIVDERSDSFESSLKSLEVLAEQTGDKALLARVDDAKARIRALQSAESEAREAEKRAESRALAAEAAAKIAGDRLGAERERNQFLTAASSLDQDTILNLHHQIIIHASGVHLAIKRMMGRLRNGSEIAADEWVDFLDKASYRNSQILTAARFATKSGYKQQSATVTTDLAGYVRDYIEMVSSLWAPQKVSITVEDDGKEFPKSFKPIEVGILIDNLVANAAKANAAAVAFFLSVAGRAGHLELIITVADDGAGWSPKISAEEAFDKGVTTTDGSGLGLFHVRQVVQSLGGTIEAITHPYSDELDGAQLTLRVPA